MDRGYFTNDYVNSYFYLGFGMYYGVGVVANKEKGRAVLEALAAGGERRSQTLLSVEDGLPQNKDQAMDLLYGLKDKKNESYDEAQSVGAPYDSAIQDIDQAKLILDSIIEQRRSKSSSLMFSCANAFIN